jgi:enoyl-CoA hydratase/carnithine racemase/methionyl-tRNA formyltransferase
MIEAAELVKPHLIICPFLTSLVPQQIHDAYLTLIVHPGPPGDAGPSALDWLLMGDDGSEADSERLLRENRFNPTGRSHWGVTVLQATREFDAGPVWAFEQFPVNINDSAVTKSSLYRAPVTQAAVVATVAAIDRITAAASLASVQHGAPISPPASPKPDDPKSEPTGCISPGLVALKDYAELSVSRSEPFLGGPTHHRPLLKAAQRNFEVRRHVASIISRRIRSADSQPGCLSDLFGPKLYLYGGAVEDPTLLSSDGGRAPGSIVAIRGEAVCVATCDNKGIWITHIRRVKSKTDSALWPKVPAASGLMELGLVAGGNACRGDSCSLMPQNMSGEWAKSLYNTFQEIWVDFATHGRKRVAYLYFDFYNGAMSTGQCNRMVQCLEYILSRATDANEPLPLTALVLMGGSSYFSNGIHLNVIESAADPAMESWLNINAINDVVQKVLLEVPAYGITTVAAVRGNCAAGGVALAAACDVVLASQDSVLNPAYRALGLYGSEYHSISYAGRCGGEGARTALRSMTPLSADDARSMGLVDHVLRVSADALTCAVQAHVDHLLGSGGERAKGASPPTPGAWKQSVDVSSAGLARARAMELGQMAKDFWSARSERYHSRRRDFVRKAKPSRTPLRFAAHRRLAGMMDEEEQDAFDSEEWFRAKQEQERKRDWTRKIVCQINDFADGSLQVKDNGGGAADAPTLFGCYYNA